MSMAAMTFVPVRASSGCINSVMAASPTSVTSLASAVVARAFPPVGAGIFS